VGSGWAGGVNRAMFGRIVAVRSAHDALGVGNLIVRDIGLICGFRRRLIGGEAADGLTFSSRVRDSDGIFVHLIFLPAKTGPVERPIALDARILSDARYCVKCLFAIFTIFLVFLLPAVLAYEPSISIPNLAIRPLDSAHVGVADRWIGEVLRCR